MKNINKVIILLVFMIFWGGCSNEKTEVNRVSDISTNLEPAQTITLEWKAVFEELGDHFQLYITVNGETDYYAGDYWPGVSFELNEDSYVSDAPDDAICTLSTLWTGEGQWFYIYQKNDDELVVMNHPVIYPEWYISSMKEEIGAEEYIKRYKEYKEILSIPIEKGSQIKIEESVIIQKPEGTVG